MQGCEQTLGNITVGTREREGKIIASVKLNRQKNNGVRKLTPRNASKKEQILGIFGGELLGELVVVKDSTKAIIVFDEGMQEALIHNLTNTTA